MKEVMDLFLCLVVFTGFSQSYGGGVSLEAYRQLGDQVTECQNPSFHSTSHLFQRLGSSGNPGPALLRDLKATGYPVDASELCFNQTVFLAEGLTRNLSFAFTMLDAWGKLPSGVVTGDMHWPGDYDECVSVHSSGTGNLAFTGKYCSAIMPFQSHGVASALTVGLCMPSGCSGADVLALIDSVPVIIDGILRANLTGDTPFTVTCDEPRSLDAKAIISIVICSIFLALLVAGTIYDIYLSEYAPKEVKDIPKVASNGTSSNGVIAASSNGVIASSDGVIAGQDIEGKSEAGERTPLINGDVTHAHVKVIQGKTEPGLPSKLLLAFSAYTNSRKIMSTAQPKGALTCLHGIRVFSILWVVLGHTFVFSISILRNPSWLAEVIKRQSFGAILNATVSVDTFFVMSGLLLAYLTLRQLEKEKGKLGAKVWVMVYVHRYIRLTPVYMLLLMVWSCLLWYFGNGPYWPTTGTLDPNCAQNWWTNLLYVNNVVNAKEMCMDWSWYLANDMQFFAISVPLVYLLYRYRWVGLALTSAVTVGSIVAAMLESGLYKITPIPTLTNPASAEHWSFDYYFVPWTRYQTYGIGVLTGYLLHLMKGKLRIHWAMNLTLWACAAVLCLLPLYGPYTAESDPATATVPIDVFYNGMMRTSWAIGVAWVIVACATGNGGLVNKFLSWSPFVPLGRLTYCVYLTNVIVVMFYNLYSRQPVTFNDLHFTVLFFGIIIFNYAAAFVSSILWEAPTMALEKLLFKR